MNDARDDDSALRRVLREADPASGLPPLTARDAGLIRERIMLASRAAAPAPRRRGWLIGGLSAATAAAAGAIAVPLRLHHPDGELSLLSTATTFSTAVDVTVSELAIESFFPADEHTAEVLRVSAPGRTAPGS